MTARYRWLFAIALLVPVSPPISRAGAADPVARPDLELGHRTISAEKLRMHLEFIASDELEGRDTPSRGLDLAARYIATRMEYYGYQPAGENGTFYQRISMSRRRLSRDSRLTVRSGGRGDTFNLGVDFAAQGSATTSTGAIALAGFGLVSEEAHYDDYAGLDVKDKLVIVFDGYPPGIDDKLFQPERRVGNRVFRVSPNKLQIARDHGAIGLVMMRRPDYSMHREERPSPFEQALHGADEGRPRFDFQDTPHPVSIDLIAPSADRLGRVLGVDLEAARSAVAEPGKPRSTPLDARFELEFGEEVLERSSTQNVVAFLEGSDPELKDEMVAFSAHYDHLGIRPQPVDATTGRGELAGTGGSGEDRIFNGADDDGSGTVGILNLAEAFARVQRPRRSLLFIWHAGEERGLIGSQYFVDHPTRPLDRIAALFNIDMIGRNFEDKDENRDHVFLVGAAKTSHDLDQIIRDACAGRMRLDANDNRNYYRRSDHYNYAKHRVPIAFFCTGEHKDYHRVTDEVGAILFDKMKDVLDIVFDSAFEVVNRDTRPAFTGEE
jgi:hypothetical protein